MTETIGVLYGIILLITFIIIAVIIWVLSFIATIVTLGLASPLIIFGILILLIVYWLIVYVHIKKYYSSTKHALLWSALWPYSTTIHRWIFGQLPFQE